jgi:hypothetical protein
LPPAPCPLLLAPQNKPLAPCTLPLAPQNKPLAPCTLPLAPQKKLNYEEQRFLEDHHSGGGVYPDGSVDCFGNDLMHEMHAVEWKM